MTALELPTTKRQRLFVIVLVVVILITVMVLWWGMAPPKEAPPIGTVQVGAPGKLAGEIPTKLDLSIFDHPWFEKAKIHGDLPVEAGDTGRENPFKPY